ncbi:hypothetical protein CEQ90_09665 [Lewinellaceae bacterium SD302]|nr:hypothetical protein CEQ90_09665 [Lewinellaceae bacterium SD302]
MKLLMYLLLCFALFACGGSDATAQASSSTTATTAPEMKTEAPAENSENPCETISPAEVAAALGWAGSNDGMPTTMRDGRLQSCYYSSNDNVGAATISISTSNENTIASKRLERSFTTSLEKTDGQLKYEEVSASLGDQAIYGSGKNGPAFSYRLDWRVGNTVSYSVDASYYQERDKDDVLVALKELAAKL